MKKVAIAYNKILLTHDGSELASFALPHAIKLAQVFNAKIILVQVIDTMMQVTAKLQPPHINYGGVYATDDMEEVYENQKAEALENLAEVKNELATIGIQNIEIKIAEGSPGEEIVDLAKRQKCDLIITSTRGRSGLGRALLGSVADHVVRNAPCPVLLIHPQEE